MSDAKHLEKEIKYWSVLIQQHKNASEHGQKGAKKAEISSKYSWKKTETNNKRASGSQLVDTKSSQNAVNKIPQGSTNTTSSQPSAAKRAKVAIDSKFKWSRGSSSSVATVPRASPPSKVADFSKGNTQKPAAASSDAGTKFNPKFKWTKTSVQQSSSPAPLQMRVKVSEDSAKRTMGASSFASPLKKTPQKLYSRSSQYTVNRHNSPHSLAKENFGSKRFGQSHANHRRHPMAVIKSQRKTNTLKWNRHQHATWHANRSGLKNNVSHPTDKGYKNMVVNPYKLNRVSKSVKSHLKRSSPSPKHRKAQAVYRNSNKVLDRRPMKTHGGKPTTEGQGVHASNHVPTVKQVLASRVLQRSHHAAMLKSKRDTKKKQHCLYFGRFGKCMRGDSCKYIHDPSRVAVCTRFLRGTCRDANCSFSHKLEKEKTPVCLFFIRGKCTAANCPYLHVYSGKNASVCKKFALNGFCEEADQCKALHIKCCPEFYETGTCTKEKDCKLPHFARNVHSTKPEKDQGRSKNETQDTVLQQGLDINPGASDAPSTSSTPDFLSLKVDSPQPLNKPFKGNEIQIKPRFGKLKLKKQRS